MYRDRDAPPLPPSGHNYNYRQKPGFPFSGTENTNPMFSRGMRSHSGPRPHCPPEVQGHGRHFMSITGGMDSNPRRYHPYNNHSQSQPRPHPHLRRGSGPRPYFNHTNGHGSGQGHVRDDHKDNPWMTPELLKLIEEKDKLWKMQNENRSEENCRNFKIKRMEVNLAVNDAKVLYHQKNPVIGEFGSYSQVFRTVPKSSHSAFYCDPCDKEFFNQEQLDEHKTEHITCKLDGCTYTAHAKLVMKHIELQHSNNMFERIKGFDTPEEIEKWKAERRKNYPIPENIERKKAEMSERRSRGEILTAQEDFPGIENFRHKIIPAERRPQQFRRGGFGYQSDGDEDFLPSSRRRSNHPVLLSYNKSPAIRLRNFYTDVTVTGDGNLVGSTREIWASNDTDEQSEETTVGAHSKAASDSCDEEFNITDDEDDFNVTLITHKKEDEEPEPEPIPQPQSKSPIQNCYKESSPKKGLLGLSCYGSESDAEPEEGEVKSDDEIVASEKLAVTSSSASNAQTVRTEGNSSDEEAPEELPAKVLREDDDVLTNKSLENDNRKVDQPLPKRETKPSKHRRSKASATSNIQSKAKRVARKYSLLQRLLAPEIRREKNMVLQVCRFLVDNNFLDEAEDNSPPDNPTTSPTPEKITDNSLKASHPELDRKTD